MSHFLDRLNFLSKTSESFSDDHGSVTNESRDWEQAYRNRWSHDKIVRSTHGVNCTGSCSWKVFVKNGLITWELQQTDYPRTRPDLPNHEPRGCPRGASYSWYVYSAQRVKYPMLRGELAKLWREARKTKDPIAAWQYISSHAELAKSYKSKRGLGGFVRTNWDEAYELIAAANAFTIKTYGPDRVFGFSPIPAMSMVSYAAGSRYLSLIGGVPLSFYDWYCDLPPSSPQIWGEQTDVAESADWYNSTFLMVWGSNIPMTRTPDAHFYSEVRYKGTKTVAVSSDYGEMVKFSDIWLSPKQGTDAALAMAMGHVILKEFHIDRPSDYFSDYCRRLTDMPVLVTLKKQDGYYTPSYYLRASQLNDKLNEKNNPEWKTLVIDENSGDISVAKGSIGFRWGEKGKWNLKSENSQSSEIRAQLSLIKQYDESIDVAFDYFGGKDANDVMIRKVPVKKIQLANGESCYIATVFDLTVANYGLDRGLGGTNVASSYEDDLPYTPKWQEKHTGVPANQVIRVAREFAQNAHDSHGKSMVIVGAGLNHWYHMDMSYRGIINMLMMCGCIGQSGGGWAHYVGQEKLRPQTGWAPLAFALDWQRPARQMNSTSFFYAHTSQWRHEKLSMDEVLAPTQGHELKNISMIDYNAKAERMGWLPSAPQLSINPLKLTQEAETLGLHPVEYAVSGLKHGQIDMACNDPDNVVNFPRNLFVWRSNILGSSGKGHEYFLKYLLGTQNAVMSNEQECIKPKEITVRPAAEGKLDLLTVLDFRMSTTCLYADVILPTATWYEKDDLNTSDMHPFIHPLSEAVQPLWESKTDWEIYKGLAKKFSELGKDYLGVQKDLVLTPLMHDTAQELGQAFDAKDWKKGECEPIPGKTMPAMAIVERDYGAIYDKFTSIGPLLEKLGNGGKGINWKTEDEVNLLRHLNKTNDSGIAKNQPKLDTAIDAAEMILTLAPETNGHVAVKAWQALSENTGIDHTHLAKPREHDSIRFRDVQAQPRKIISSPIWSGLESDDVSYNAGYTNVHELIPWRTLTGRQQFYQDHQWMRAFGEGFCVYKPAVDLKTTQKILGQHPNGEKEIVLNFITPHQKWGIHSTYSDNLRLLTLSRGGPHVWISEVDAHKAGLVDNDWVEVFNINGSITARVVVSQRVPETMILMYHAQEKIVNVPGSEVTGFRGGIHNSVTKTVLKPTHMIGGYAQLSWGFNYYGTVGTNRDEFVIVRKMKHVDWLDTPATSNAEQQV
ncbi:nitrate reductase subunit alpha [Acinetobacter gerneri]|uniref:nitrate reductase (quinone) n=1 Tax=Acinetobacter gerneri TaxID=202952 RepID=A0AAW8JH81_9GAMM|nr:nitrate reductase subunit alpha [Acinetobacter gerneri]MDQ9009582.1 nitrate reductase subunit alpha [Acinetobacter gerneri]MDQ9013822.1 nitrate reductase subunit alpha [Acinetobacter gerneri]MDQ9024990.1 nitrate reductase subunit alpha [Acinetobacter gerneri]MDQ9052250.1 nitrate reductase subunit alpha [Acinetobacter gerneri]MDQ9059671.1 nitrate reductase subunit alpha [Acinetobacter gerneri]